MQRKSEEFMGFLTPLAYISVWGYNRLPFTKMKVEVLLCGIIQGCRRIVCWFNCEWQTVSNFLEGKFKCQLLLNLKLASGISTLLPNGGKATQQIILKTGIVTCWERSYSMTSILSSEDQAVTVSIITDSILQHSNRQELYHVIQGCA